VIEFKNLSDEEKKQVIDRATSWYREHLHHVIKLVKGQLVAYSPSGSDLFRPELWKSAHWKWFTETYILGMVEE